MANTARRDYGSGAVYRRCAARYGCPPAEVVTTADGGTAKRRPDHDKSCKAPWVGTVELGWENGRRKRKPVQAKTKPQLIEKLRKLDPAGTVTNVPTVAKWLERWLDEIIVNKVTPKTLTGYRWAVRKYLIPNVGRHRLDELTPAQIQRLHATLRKTPKERGDGTLSRTSIQQIHACLSAALADAEPFDYLPVRGNPAQRVDQPGRAARELPELDAEQAALLLRHVADDPLGSRWAFALLTGQRRGECLGLRWSHLQLDPMMGQADVAWQLQRYDYRHGCGERQGKAWPCGRRFGGDCDTPVLDVRDDYEYHQLDGGLCLARPKAGRRKLVPLIPPMVAWLQRRRDEQADPGPHDLVWTRDDGRPIDPRADWQAWHDLLKDCGLPQVRPHSMRHTCVSLLYALRVPEVVIQQIVGHSTVTMTRAYKNADLGPARHALAQLGDHLQLPQLGELTPTETDTTP